MRAPNTAPVAYREHRESPRHKFLRPQAKARAKRVQRPPSAGRYARREAFLGQPGLDQGQDVVIGHAGVGAGADQVVRQQLDGVVGGEGAPTAWRSATNVPLPLRVEMYPSRSKSM